jgi:hypothetical protein
MYNVHVEQLVQLTVNRQPNHPPDIEHGAIYLNEGATLKRNGFARQHEEPQTKHWECGGVI